MKRSTNTAAGIREAFQVASVRPLRCRNGRALLVMAMVALEMTRNGWVRRIKVIAEC